MSFYEQVRSDVLRHGAINNSYPIVFSGDVTDKEFREFAVEFYNFALLPRILAAQLVNTEDEAVADELTKVPIPSWGRVRQTSARIAVSKLLAIAGHRHSRRDDHADAAVHQGLYRRNGASLREWKPCDGIGRVIWSGEYGDYHVGPSHSRPDAFARRALCRHGHDVFRLSSATRV